MMHGARLLRAGQGLAQPLVHRAATVTLEWDVRQKSRFDCTDSQGRRVGVFLSRGTVLRGGDVLVAEDGSLVRVIAAPQAVLVITPEPRTGTPFDLTRAAYHLGNRHVPIELAPGHLKIEPDHVLAEMVRAMGLDVSRCTVPFEPESGAYGGHNHAGGHHHGAHHGHPDHAGG
ncbi:urease accessory protein UreE [Ramlibacter sp. RBP-2]|uniref:Urease accessory protein UreE n=2 Tax=Ramlibacter lithotrophicus TaxID=2606681 RepID=A0A7X6DKN8_9BURK|nr:urease accessory protein UreE [Ramlibacter lithotrophicus]NKE68910.1 urease accessory protein UreE [Ramlibacter lithotrophicus]